jgi:hypothetical protein
MTVWWRAEAAAMELAFPVDCLIGIATAPHSPISQPLLAVLLTRLERVQLLTYRRYGNTSIPCHTSSSQSLPRGGRA